MRRLLLLSLALTASASQINGHWTDCQDVGHHCQMEQTFNFQAEGERLTGTVTWRQEEWTRGITRKEIVNISDGKIRGNEISFTTAHKTKGYLIIPPFLVFPHDRTWHYSYKGVVSRDQIKLTRTLDRKRPPVPVGRVCCISSSGKVKGQELTLIRGGEVAE